MNIISKVVMTTLLVLLASITHGEIIVIVHPSNEAVIEKADVSRIFLGKNRNFPGGDEAIPISFGFATSEAEAFSRSLLEKSPKQLKAYWAKMIFTGQGTPPKEMESTAQILELVSKNPNLIGYVPVGSETSAVRVVGKY